MRPVVLLATSTLAAMALAATTCLVAIPDLEQGPAPGADAAAGSLPDGGGAGDSSSGGSGGLGAAGAGGARPSYAEVVMGDTPIGYWRLGEGEGGAALDEVPPPIGPHHGSYTNAVLGVPGAIAGDSDTAARFEGDSYLTLGTQDDFDFTAQTPFSLEGWFRRLSGDDYPRRLFSKEVPPNEDHWSGYGVSSAQDELVLFRVRDGGVEEIGAEPLTFGQFEHVVATYDGSDLRLYVNGQLAAGPEPSSNWVAHNWGFLGVGVPRGVALPSYRFDGEVDELAVYETVLTPAQIEAHYRAGAP